MKYLFVGDPHVTPDEIDDCRALMDYVIAKAVEHNATVVLMGDQHHTHSVLRLEVVGFWKKVFSEMEILAVRCFALKGNHDCFVEPGMSGCALDVYREFKNLVLVTDRPHQEGGVLFVPYCHTEEEFLNMCKQGLNTRTLVCHQTFDGSKYENGFLAPDGFDLTKVPKKQVLSGHIHTPQSFGMCKYIGAPRWRSIDDANVERHLWLYDFNELGEAGSTIAFPTGGDVCREIRRLTDTPAEPASLDLDKRHRYHVDIVGPSEWVEKRKMLFAPVARVRTRKTDGRAPRVKESDGIDVSFMRFLSNYKSKCGTSTDMLRTMVKERMGLQCSL